MQQARGSKTAALEVGLALAAVLPLAQYGDHELRGTSPWPFGRKKKRKRKKGKADADQCGLCGAPLKPSGECSNDECRTHSLDW